MTWKLLLTLPLLLVLFIGCSGDSLGNDDAREPTREPTIEGGIELTADDEDVAGIFARALRYMEAHCLEGQRGLACNRRVEDLGAICAVAQAGGGEYVQWGGAFEDKQLTISGHLRPFCDRLEIIYAEPVFMARPHMIELAQDVEASMGN